MSDRPARPTVARVFVAVAIAEAVSWALLLVGIFFKRVVDVTDVGVTVFGPVHGAVFVAYVAVTLVAWRTLRWSFGTAALALLASVPPFTTVWFERWAQRTGRLPRPAPAPVG
ncbi:DUF3817 domain-containing protein [Modestobacter sp. I12A-02628]|uniref:DUF3817 domain-containing protein n=1 Tax=Goekera deserti TaxID=2497753 RepID=A0A7K3W9H3_9ACTN|nr:DUF3817 domain-containing protein [Goekera deserti]MPQ98810.1 DUF3817 domain-containing protein [Goekera deserti]NDI49692.1 DUF3817 domain-containing protein [Goekera deserti]NEL53115.1 DUF3817 domain-containing protein [Goekera deserti]